MALIKTTKGLMPEEALRRVDVFEDHDTHTVTAVEHYDGDELVRRGAHVHMKQGLVLAGELEAL